MKRKNLIVLSVCLIVGFILSLFFFLGFFTSLRYKTTDKLFLSNKPNDNILIVSIDNESLQNLGRWPWDRKIHADLVNKINQGDPTVIGVDINFPEVSNEESDKALSEAIARSGNVILPVEADLVYSKNGIQSRGFLLPIEEIRNNAFGLGMTNTPPDQDGVFRRAPLTVELENEKYDHFIKKVSDIFLEKNQYIFPEIKKDEMGRMIFNYRGGKETFSWISAQSVLEDDFDVSIFRDKIVLVGATASDLHDEQMVPTSSGRPMPGVEILANGIDTIISNNFLQNISIFHQVVIILCLALFVAIALIFTSIFVGSILTFLAFVVYLFIALILFDKGYILDILYPFLSVVFVFISGMVVKYFFEAKEKQYIKTTFSRYVSSDVIDDILSDPKKLQLGGKEAELSILFSDIRGFTAISEKLSPKDLVKLMNDYLTKMSNIIMESQGVVDKYIGDAIMAFWGAPIEVKDHAEKSCFSALNMVEVLEENQDEWYKKYGVDLDIGIGINTGEVIVGNMGSEQRFDYTAMGDSVNLASRLEGITKQYGVRVVISEFTYNQVKDKFYCRYLDKVAVKGKNKGVEIYQLINYLDKVDPKDQKKIEAFETGVEMYKGRSWDEAIIQFEKILSEFPEDGPSKVYRNRCEELKNNDPGENWDGIFVMKTK